jgi:hypothetical protein
MENKDNLRCPLLNRLGALISRSGVTAKASGPVVVVVVYEFLDDSASGEGDRRAEDPRIRDGPTRSRRLRGALEAVCRELMEGEVSELIGAEHGERRPDDRMTPRNGYRSREWQTTAGTVELQIPKLRGGIYFPVVSGAASAFGSRRCWP